MRDKFNREIDYMRISVTDFCNLRCIYCMPEEGVLKKDHSEILTVGEIIDAARAAASLGVKKIRITGGEPLVKHGIINICKGVSEIEGIEEVCMTTNGILLPQYADALKEAGISRFNISLDTLNPEKFRDITRVGNLNDVLRGIDAIKEAGFKGTKINTVLMKGFNDDEIEAFGEFAEKHDVEVRFIELMPMGAMDEKENYLASEEVLNVLSHYNSVGMSGVAEIYENPQGTRIGLIKTISCKFCETCNKIRLTADGHIKPCLHVEDGPRIKGCTYDEMLEIMKDAIYNKPDTRGALDTDNDSKSGRSMSQIGG